MEDGSQLFTLISESIQLIITDTTQGRNQYILIGGQLFIELNTSDSKLELQLFVCCLSTCSEEEFVRLDMIIFRLVCPVATYAYQGDHLDLQQKGAVHK